MDKMRCQKGLLLVDVIIAILMVLIALTAVIQLFIPASKSIKTAYNRTIAYSLAQERVDQLKAKNNPGYLKILVQNSTTTLQDIVDLYNSYTSTVSNPSNDETCKSLKNMYMHVNYPSQDKPTLLNQVNSKSVAPQFTRATTVRISPRNSENRLVETVVTVAWQENGNNETIHVTTYLERQPTI